jgi:two-component system, OmpR family, aerobic respiration control sensor histidine kinase ArcB
MLGCEVEIASDGNTAIQCMNNHYDLIFLDIGLPDMSGLEVCQKMHLQNKIQKTPVIALTALSEEIKEQCLLAGMDDFAIKPLSLKQFDELLIKWVYNY